MSEAWSNKINRYHPELQGDPFKGFKEKRKVKIIPKKNRFIPDILPNNGRIYDETVMELNQKEILRCLSDADVYEILEDGSEVLITFNNKNDTNLSDEYDGEGILTYESAEDIENKNSGVSDDGTANVGEAEVGNAEVE